MPVGVARNKTTESMGMKFYRVQAGTIVSSFDGDEHFISERQLVSLYKVNPKHCLNFMSQLQRANLPEDAEIVTLKPRYDGNYKI